MSSNFFDDEDIVEEQAPAKESFFDTEDIAEDNAPVPIGGEMSLSQLMAEEEQAAPQPMPEPEVTQGEAALKGTQQGLTFGTADEMGAGIESGLDRMQGLLHTYTGLVGESPSQFSKRMAEEGMGGDLPPTSPDEVYEDALARNRSELSAAEEQYPITTGAADVAASMLMPIPGAGAARVAAKAAPKLAKGVAGATKGLTKTQQGMAGGLGVGLLEGAGRTEEDLTSAEGMSDVLTSGLMGQAGGYLGGKLSKSLEPDELRKTGTKLLEEAEDNSLRAAGISPKEMSKQFEKQKKRLKSDEGIEGAGVTALDEGIVDWWQKPKTAWERTEKALERTSKQYEDLTEQFTKPPSVSRPGWFHEGQARVMAEQQADELIETVEDALSKNSDNLNEGMEKAVKADLSTFKEELVQAYSSPNPVRELQDMYVKHNDKFFKAAEQGLATRDARAVMRTTIKKMQRDFVKEQSPEAFEQFEKLDKLYSELLDLKHITLARAGQNPKAGGLSDLSRGITARVITGIPGIEIPVTAASVASKKILGTDLDDVAKALAAEKKLKRARKYFQMADDPGKLREAVRDLPTTTGAMLGAGTAALTDGTDKQMEPYKVHKKTARIAEQATPEMLTEQAQSIREQHGENGEQLATILERMAEKDVQGRRAMMFHILQKPEFKKMLISDVKE